jgi:uncharacterized protein
MKYYHLIVIAALLIARSGLCIDPLRSYILTPDSIGIRYDSANIKTSDGAILYSWIYYPAKGVENNSVIVLAYPDKANMSHWVYFAGVFVQRGYTVVTFDYRGFGKSSYFNIDRNFLYHAEFATDLTAVVKFVDRKFKHKKIGVWALSMGTMVLVESLRKTSKIIDFVIGDGFVTNLDKIKSRIYDTWKDVMGSPRENDDYQNSIALLKMPLLIFAASNDKITTVNDAKELQMKLGEKAVTEVYQGEHLRGFQAGEGPFGEYYLNTIDSFLKGI